MKLKKRLCDSLSEQLLIATHRFLENLSLWCCVPHPSANRFPLRGIRVRFVPEKIVSPPDDDKIGIPRVSAAAWQY